MNTAAKGRRGEHRSRQLLEAAGYVVFRSAASKRPFDLPAFSSVEVLLVQVKTGDGWPRPAEVEVMQAVPVPPNARKICHRWRPRQRWPDVREV